MSATIVRMLRLGRSYKVKLSCGCAFSATLEEAERDQLFIGKAFLCAKHGGARQ